MFGSLSTVFPPNDFTLLAVIIALPLLGAIVNGVFGKRAGAEAVSLMALTAIGVSFIASVVAFFMLKDATAAGRATRFVWTGWEWASVSLKYDVGTLPIAVAFSIDALSGAMALIVTGVGFLIHLYSVKYMEGDPGYHRYFSYLNLFIFAMLVLILGDSLPVLFVGWEGVGLCSYLLIGFWFESDYNAFAGKKAFVTNRIGDFGLLVAMGLLVYYVGALDWAGIEAGRTSLLQSVKVWPIGNDVPPVTFLAERFSALKGFADWANTPRYVSAASLVGLSLFLGCAGKSAQIPLYVWLPDAMAGPTPVSALIHAATMVTAGVYLVCRLSGVFVLSPAAMFTVALVGALTAVFAATIALVQNDIKRVLAYSTVSQLGYMFLGAGVGAFSAGFFHVVTHAFFKACLFLGAGSVIHAMHARIHDTDASQDMRNMGGLKNYLPITFFTFLAAWAAIVGFPLTAGFFSKDEILLKAKTSTIALAETKLGSGPTQITVFQWPTWGPSVLYALGLIGAVLTAFYMTRLVIGIFMGEFRGWTITRRWKPAEAHGHAHEEPGPDLQGPKPHESPWQMTLPLVVLGALSIVAGALNAHAFFHSATTDGWLAPVFKKTEEYVKEVPGAGAFENVALAFAFGAFFVGAFVAYWTYVMQRGEPAQQMAERAPGLYRLVYDKWRIDELYEETVIGAVDSLAEFALWFDRWVIDGIIARFTSFVIAAVGTGLRYVQTGRVQAYAATMVLGIGGLGWFVVAPHPTAQLVADESTGSYSLDATSGLGYRYRWDVDGDGKWDSEDFSPERKKVEFKLEPSQKRTVRLEVVNAFGRVASRDYRFERPKPDRSRGTTSDLQRAADAQQIGAIRGGGNVPGQFGVPGQPAQPAQPGQPTVRMIQPNQFGQQVGVQPQGVPPRPLPAAQPGQLGQPGQAPGAAPAVARPRPAQEPRP